MRIAVHRVGLTAAGVGVAALVALPFGKERAFRIATGTPVSLADALPAALALIPVALWLVIAVVSLIGGAKRPLAVVRGFLGGTLIITLLWLAGWAAENSLADAGAFARWSVGAGVWLSAFSAFALLIGSRREVGTTAPSGIAMTGLPVAGTVALLLTGRLSSLGMAAEYRNVSDQFWLWVTEHLIYAASSMALAVVLGVTLGIVAYRRPRLAQPVFAATSVVQTIPGLAMIGVLAVPLGYFAQRFPFVRALGIGVLGWAPVVIALTLYALLVIVRNTFAGLQAVPRSAVDAAMGMGMTEGQSLRKVELPLASPILFSGTRTAFQQTIGNATLAVFVAAGSLGRPIFQGVSQQAFDLVLLGSIALVALALTVDILMRALEVLIVPRRSRGTSR